MNAEMVDALTANITQIMQKKTNRKEILPDRTVLYTIVSALRLGIKFRIINNKFQVDEVTPDSISDILGIKVGDVITRVNDLSIPYDDIRKLNQDTGNVLTNYIATIIQKANEHNPLMLYIRPIQEEQQQEEEKPPDGGSKSRKKSRHYKNTKRRRRKSRHNKKSKM